MGLTMKRYTREEAIKIALFRHPKSIVYYSAELRLAEVARDFNGIKSLVLWCFRVSVKPSDPNAVYCHLECIPAKFTYLWKFIIPIVIAIGMCLVWPIGWWFVVFLIIGSAIVWNGGA